MLKFHQGSSLYVCAMKENHAIMTIEEISDNQT